jgi:O-antigen/teichoic acid export membrane protein
MQGRLIAAAIGAARWNYAGFLCRSVAGFLVGIVLARLLGPKPFGQLGVAAIVYGLGNLIADAGFASALVQAPELTPRQVRCAFTMQVLIGSAMTAFAFVAAPYVGVVVRDAGIVPVLRAVSPLFLVQSLGQTSTGLLKRRMDFRTIQIAQVSSYLIGYAAVGVLAALLGCGVWSLVAAQLAQPFLYSLIAYRYTRHSPQPALDRSGLRLFRFGTQITGANIINWTISNLDNVLVARTFGPFSLGLYSRMFDLASNPAQGFVSTFQQVLFTSCSRAEQRIDRMRRAYLAALGAVALITMPLFWSMAVCSQFVVIGLFGQRWIDAVPLFTAFATAMPLFALMATAGPVLAAADLVHREIRTQGASLVVSALLFLLASRISLAAVAWAVVPAYGFRFWWTTRPTLQLVGVQWREALGVIAGPACAAAFTAGCVFCTSRSGFLPAAGRFHALLALAGVGAVSMVAVALIAGRRVVPAAILDPILANRNEFPGFVSRPLTTLAARWRPAVETFPDKLSTPAGASKPL